MQKTGHFWLWGGDQGLKYDHLHDKEFEPSNELFNAVYQILNQIFKWCLVFLFSLSEKQKKSVFNKMELPGWS